MSGPTPGGQVSKIGDLDWGRVISAKPQSVEATGNNETLAACVACELRTYITEQKREK